MIGSSGPTIASTFWKKLIHGAIACAQSTFFDSSSCSRKLPAVWKNFFGMIGARRRHVGERRALGRCRSRRRARSTRASSARRGERPPRRRCVRPCGRRRTSRVSRADPLGNQRVGLSGLDEPVDVEVLAELHVHQTGRRPVVEASGCCGLTRQGSASLNQRVTSRPGTSPKTSSCAASTAWTSSCPSFDLRARSRHVDLALDSVVGIALRRCRARTRAPRVARRPSPWSEARGCEKQIGVMRRAGDPPAEATAHGADVDDRVCPAWRSSGVVLPGGVHSSTASVTSCMRRIEFWSRLPSLNAVWMKLPWVRMRSQRAPK